jgi:hypothetical protein
MNCGKETNAQLRAQEKLIADRFRNNKDLKEQLLRIVVSGYRRYVVTPAYAVNPRNAVDGSCGCIAYSASSSKSSSLSRYFMMLRLILEESTQVTKSSMFLVSVSYSPCRYMFRTYLVTRYAGSVTTSVPTRT